MNSCPRCLADNLPDDGLCPNCQAESNADDYEDVPTQRTMPRLLVMRPSDRPKPPTSDGTAHGDDVPLLTPTNPCQPPFKLKVVRGLRISVEYPLFDGQNLIGRADERPVDIDLRDQEPRDRVWASRNHAVVRVAEGALTIEDLNSTNGTYLNRHRLPPGSKRPLKTDDLLQIGTIQLKVSG